VPVGQGERQEFGFGAPANENPTVLVEVRHRTILRR
jgi:hypothetical protein